VISDHTALRRQWILLKALTSRRRELTVKEMAVEVGVCEKTIRRDLELFRSVGFPVEETIGARGRKSWRMKESWGQPPLAFDFEEAAALYVSRRLLDPLEDTWIGEASRNAFAKIKSSLGSNVLIYLDRFHRWFYTTSPDRHDYANRSQVISDLQIALEDRRSVRLSYCSEHDVAPSTREVIPHSFVKHHGALYLSAHAQGDAKEKTYKVDRIESVALGASPAHPPDGFDITSHMANSFGVYQSDGPSMTVKVRFAPAVARYVAESRRHTSQRLTHEPDGGLIADFTLTSTVEIKSWILSFGAKAVVLEPETLRQEVAADLARALAAYNNAIPEERPCQSST
jgi:predicted DNA-binding transcriptional regulator YafY